MFTNDALVRLRRARDVLREVHDRTLTIDEVAREAAMLPFTSFDSFVGVSPSEYRRRARSMVAVPGMAATHLFPGCLSLMGPAFAIFEKQQHS